MELVVEDSEESDVVSMRDRVFVEGGGQGDEIDVGEGVYVWRAECRTSKEPVVGEVG